VLETVSAFLTRLSEETDLRHQHSISWNKPNISNLFASQPFDNLNITNTLYGASHPLGKAFNEIKKPQHELSFMNDH